MTSSIIHDQRTLLFVSEDEARQRTVRALETRSRPYHVCATADELCLEAEEGASLFVLSEAVFSHAFAARLTAWLEAQPAWSNPPIILLLEEAPSETGVSPFAERLGSGRKLTLLEPPYRVPTLVSALDAAWAARRRQYEVRDLLAELREKTVRLEHEIHDRKKAQAALRASEEHFRAFFDNTIEPILLADDAGCYVEANAAACTLTGYSFEELHALTIWDISVGISRDSFGEMWDRFKQAGTMKGEYRLRRKDGRVIDVEFKAVANVEPGLHLSALTDVTARKRAERHTGFLADLNERLLQLRDAETIASDTARSLAECLDLAWCVLQEADAGTPHVLAVHDGRDVEEPFDAGTPYDTAFPLPPDAAARLRTGDAVIVEDVRTAPLTASHHDAYSQHGIAAFTAIPWAHDGGWTKTLIAASDVPRTWLEDELKLLHSVGSRVWPAVEQARAEQALRRSEDRFRVALKHSPIVVFNCDRALRFTWIYNPLSTLLPEDIIGKRADEILPPQDAAAFMDFQRTVLSSGQGQRRELHVRIEGRLYYLDVTAEPLRDHDGTVIGLTVAAMDITEHTQTEVELRSLNETLEQRIARRTRELEEANTLLMQGINERERLEQENEQIRNWERQRFAQDLHDGLCQQLTSLSVMFDVFYTRFAPDDEDAQRLAHRIKDLTNRAVSETRALARGLFPVEMNRGGLSKALRDLAKNISEAYGISCDVTDHAPLTPDDESVATNLYRIAQEAVSNAVRHGKARHVDIVLRVEDEHFLQEIVDDGSGIPDDVLRNGERGIGLRTMQSRSRVMSASLDIRPGTSGGTVVTCRVPLEGVSTQASSAPVREVR